MTIDVMELMRHIGEDWINGTDNLHEEMKDHEIREAINELKSIAIEYHDAQQLRERIVRVVLRIVNQVRQEKLTSLDTDSNLTSIDINST